MPVIGIGAGPDTDGQILVLYDILDITTGRKPRFVRNFMEGAGTNQQALANYVQGSAGRPVPGSRARVLTAMETVTTIAAVRERVRAWHREGLRVAFVPTMGNLHPGHVSLIEAARRHGDRFVASIFVNPMQFGPNEDFAHYPRTPTQDERMLAAAGCDLMFMPDVAEIYPNGAERATRVDVPGLSRILCGEFRPGAFRRRGDDRCQAVPHRGAGCGGVRREGFPTAHGDPADGGGSVHARADHRRADGARCGWAGDELAQSVSDAAGAAHRAADPRRF